MEITDLPARNEGRLILAMATASNGDAYVIAVSADGDEYVTWAVSPGVFDGPRWMQRPSFYWGHYFHAAHHHGQAGAFSAAMADLARRAGSDAVVKFRPMSQVPAGR